MEQGEVQELAQARSRSQAFAKHEFSKEAILADPVEKKAMRPDGEIVEVDLPLALGPARFAGLLKYKKHEWIVLAFVCDGRVRRAWWNKGPDSSQVWSTLNETGIEALIEKTQPDLILVLHNHPNPDPATYCMTTPSDTDLRSARSRRERYAAQGISLMEFVCERGQPHLYFAYFNDTVAPLAPITADVETRARSGRGGAYSMRCELRRLRRVPRIPD